MKRKTSSEHNPAPIVVGVILSIVMIVFFIYGCREKKWDSTGPSNGSKKSS